MPMAGTRKHILLTLSALALLSACDDGGQTQGKSASWLDWIKGKSEPRRTVFLDNYPLDYVRETQAGNYLAGQFAQNRGDWTAAGKYFDKLIKADPNNTALQQRAMVLAMQGGDANRAIALARKVVEADPHNILALLFIASDHMSRQEYSQAAESLSHMPQQGITDFIRPIIGAWAQAPEGKVDEDMLIGNGPLHAYHALLIADYLGKVKQPEKYFIHVLAGGGADRHMLEMMADAYNREGHTELAKKIYDTLAKDGQPDIGSSRYAAMREKEENPELAKATAIQTPTQGAAEAFYNMARMLFQDKNNESALVFARLSQHLDPTKEDVKMLLASMMIEGDRLEDAIALYKSVKPGVPGYPESIRSAAEILEQKGDIDRSIKLLEQDYAQNKDVNSLIQIGDVYRRAERHAEAIKAYDRAVAAMGGKVSSDYWHVLYARGMSYERVGDMKRAEDDLEAALEFRPDHPYLLNYLGYSWADQGKKLDKAVELLTKAATLKPDDGYIADSLGWVYFKTGEFGKAVEELEKAVELVPYDPTINDHLGDAYWRVGRKQEARFQWQRALNHSKDEKVNAILQEKLTAGLAEKETPVMEAKKAVEQQPEPAQQH